jgi:hypothetical protein
MAFPYGYQIGYPYNARKAYKNSQKIVPLNDTALTPTGGVTGFFDTHV